jgi:transposase-like protein
MSQDPRGRRLSKPEKEAILNDIRSRSLSFQSISKKHRVSISTVSRLAAENGLASPRKRSSAVEKPEHSYDREQRKSVLDRMLHSIDKMVERGGLSSRQLKDLASATKELAASRRSEDALPNGNVQPSRGPSDGASYESLVSLQKDGTPKNIAALFALRDIEIARDAGDAEGEENAKERLREACRQAGLSGDDVPIDAMIAAADKEHHEKYGSSEAQAEDAEAEYQGEGRS